MGASWKVWSIVGAHLDPVIAADGLDLFHASDDGIGGGDVGDDAGPDSDAGVVATWGGLVRFGPCGYGGLQRIRGRVK